MLVKIVIAVEKLSHTLGTVVEVEKAFKMGNVVVIGQLS